MARWLIWTVLVIVWTVGLEMPVPAPGATPAGEFIVTNKYLLGKTLHVVVYAGLTAAAAWAPLASRYRCLLMFFLMAHAWGTEMLQEVLNPWCHRGGSLTDMGYDVLGIAVGAVLSWKWWSKEAQG